ncbi:MAG: putative oxygenase MesX [Cyanobacteriota bacterium]
MSASVLDLQNGHSHPGATCLNFSAYLRDYDLRFVLTQLLKQNASAQEQFSFGRLQESLSRLPINPEGLLTDPFGIAISIALNHNDQPHQTTRPTSEGKTLPK